MAFDDIVIELAIHRCRLPGAALIDEQNVAVAPHAFESAGKSRVELHGALAGAAGERHQRVGFGREVERRNNGDPQFDFSIHLAGGVERPDKRRAARLHAGHARAGADSAVLEFDRLGYRES